jgi:hypothetical protein
VHQQNINLNMWSPGAWQALWPWSQPCSGKSRLPTLRIHLCAPVTHSHPLCPGEHSRCLGPHSLGTP